jgi:hypothetical protein
MFHLGIEQSIPHVPGISAGFLFRLSLPNSSGAYRVINRKFQTEIDGRAPVVELQIYQASQKETRLLPGHG